MKANMIYEYIFQSEIITDVNYNCFGYNET